MTGRLTSRVLIISELDTNAAISAIILVAIAAAVVFHITLLSLSAILALILLAAIRPSASLAAIPAVVGFVLEPISIRSLRFSPQEVLLVSTVAGTGIHILWVGWRDRSARKLAQIVRDIRRLTLPIDIIAVLFLFVGVVSLFTVAMPAYRHESLRDFRWNILEPVIFYGLARWFYQDVSTRRLSVTLFVGGATLVALTGIIGLVTGHGLNVEGVTRVSGVYHHPNALALFLERPLLIAVGLAVLFRPNVKWIWMVPAGVIGTVLVMTFSRGAVVAAGVGIIVVLLFGQRRRLAAFVTAAGVVLGAALALTASARIDNLFSGGSGSLRLDLWESSIQMIRDHPIFGIGLDQFLYVYAPRYIKPQAWSERFTSHPHDIILDVWLRLGIMGVVLALAYVAFLIVMTIQLVRQRNALGLAASGALVVGMLHGLVDNGYFLPDLALIFWFMTALLAVEMQDRSTNSALET